MEDRYLFKAKRLDNGEWVQGNILLDIEKNKPSETYRIYPVDHVDICRIVDETTICQCTGLKDKNGTLIWENDIVKDEHGNLYKAFWQKNYYCYSWICIKSNYLPIGAQWNLWSIKSFEIELIGNIFDNKELLESEV